MKEKMKRIFFYFIVFNCFVVGMYAKGTLKVSTQIIPDGMTKKYLTQNSLLIDAGVLNTQSNINKIKLATVTVNMRAEESNDGEVNSIGITGDFNDTFKMSTLKTPKYIPLTSITKYKGGDGATMKLKVENIQIKNEVVINTASPSNDNYIFIAFPNEAEQLNTTAHALRELNYTFDLSLEIENVKEGDIIRSDVRPNEFGLEAVGGIQDIIRTQFYGTGGI